VNLRKILFLALAVLVVSNSGAKAQQTKKVIGGPELGSKISNFSLVDQKGKKRDLKTILSKGPVAVVFFRSADW